MLYRNRMVLAGSCLLMLSTALSAQPPKNGPAGVAPGSQEWADYLATQSFVQNLKDHQYELPPERVREAVDSYLRSFEGPIPKQFPDIDQLQKDLALNFDDAWTKMIDQATAAAANSEDPNVIRGIAQRLRKSLTETRVHLDNTKAKFDEIVKEEIPKTLESVKAALIQEQQAELADVLKQVVGPEMPGAERIAKASQFGGSDPSEAPQHRKEAAEAIESEVMKQLPADLSDTLIEDSYKAFVDSANEVVADGESQFDEQSKELTKPPSAISPKGIEEELKSNLQKIAKRQAVERAKSPLRPAYGIFDQISQMVPDKAHTWFDSNVAAVGVDIMANLAPEKLPPTDQEEIRKEILRDVPAHHRLDESRTRLQPAIEEMTAGGQAWITEALLKKLQESKSPGDNPNDLNGFQKEVEAVIDQPNSASAKSWSNLHRALKNVYENQLLPAIRDQIADQQARQYATPKFLSGEWTPTEGELDATPLPVNLESLRILPIWQTPTGPPQRDEQVLEETWTKWTLAATAALEITRAARDSQLNMVDERKETFAGEIARGPAQTADEWVQEFKRTVLSDWRSKQPKLSKAYPDLFSLTIDRIKSIVDELLPSIDEQRSPDPAVPLPMTIEPQPAAPSDESQPSPNRSEMTPPQETENTTPDAPREPDNSQREADSQDADKTGNGESAASKDGAGDDQGAGEGKGEGEGEGGEGNGGPGGDSTGGEGGDEEKESKDVEAQEGHGKKTDPEAGDETQNGRLAAELAPQKTPASLFYLIGFWLLLLIVVLMALGWFLHVRYLRRRLAQYEHALRVVMR